MVMKYGDQPTYKKILFLTPHHKEVIKDAIDQGLAKDEMSAIQLGIDFLEGRLTKKREGAAA